MKIFLKTLTPLHIGNGEELSSLDYVVVDKYYYRISQNQFLSFLIGQPGKVERYVRWIDEITEKLENLEILKKNTKDRGRKKDYNQKLSELRKSLNLVNFTRQEDIFPLFQEFLFKNEKISRIRFTAEPKQQIRGLIKTPDNTYYLPGTSIKGAMRTALLYSALNSSKHEDEVRNIISENLTKCRREKQKSLNENKKFRADKLAKSFADSLEHLVFYCSYYNERGILVTNDEKYDLLKVFSVSDAVAVTPSISLFNVDLYLVSREKDERGKGFEYKAVRQKQAPCIESYAENQVFELDIEFNMDYLLSLKDHLKNDMIMSGRERQWIGLREKLMNVFSLDINQLNRENLEEQRQKALHHILEKTARFSSRQLLHEGKWLKEFLGHRMDKGVDPEAIKRGFKVLSGEKDLLHMGYATGFYGITEFLYMVEKPELKNLLKEFMEFFEIGNRPGARDDRRPYVANPDKFPKSRRLADSGDRITPLGWLEINTTPFEADTVQETRNRIAEILVQESMPEVKHGPETRDFNLLKDGNVVDALVTGQENLYAVVELCCDNLSNKTGKFRYPAGFPAGTVIEAEIFFPNKKNRMEFTLRFKRVK